MQGVVVERDKAFRAQGFALKQVNTRMAQLQQQHADATKREAELIEQLSCSPIQGQPSLTGSVHTSEHSASLKKMHSRLPSSMETMRRRLEPIASLGKQDRTTGCHVMLQVCMVKKNLLESASSNLTAC